MDGGPDDNPERGSPAVAPQKAGTGSRASLRAKRGQAIYCGEVRVKEESGKGSLTKS